MQQRFVVVAALFLVACSAGGKGAALDTDLTPDPPETTSPPETTTAPCSTATFWEDADADGFGDPSAAQEACEAPAGFADNDEDCDDGDSAVHPGADELCNGVDDDCDLSIDEEATDATTWYADTDGDGVGDPDAPVVACEPPTGFVESDGDCDDGSAASHPGGTEVGDGLDNDCDTLIDEDTELGDDDGDGWAEADGDCDDALADISPDAVELCNTIDDDCDGTTDEADAADAATWYFDGDGDGFGDPNLATNSCDPGAGWVADGTDCDDDTAEVNPAAVWYLDADGDGHGGTLLTYVGCTPPAGYVLSSDDCDDLAPQVHPGAAEVCNGIDDDCDSLIDDADPDVGDRGSWYPDADLDGWGDPAGEVISCDPPGGYVAVAEDCDDLDPDRNPDTVWYLDLDLDGYGTSASTKIQCEEPAGYTLSDGDCNASNGAVYPGAIEVCNSIDDDCDGLVDDADLDATGLDVWYADDDGDGFGTPFVTLSQCTQPGGYVSSSGDCDDTLATVSPVAPEVCNALDDDCDELVDDEDPNVLDRPTWYADDDLDGFGDPLTGTDTCDPPAGWISDPSDCDDSDPDVHPLATEVCGDLTDNDCDLRVDQLPYLYFFEHEDHVRIADHDALVMGTAGTFEAWVWYEGVGNRIFNKWVIGQEDYWLSVSEAAGTFSGGVFIGGTSYVTASSSPELVPLDRWVHLAFVWDGSEARTYIDGVLASAIAQVGTPLASSGDAFIGYNQDRYDSTSVGAAQGFIGDLRISTVARYDADFVPATELVADFNTAALYPLDERSGTVASDATVYANDGTITGPEWQYTDCRTP